MKSKIQLILVAALVFTGCSKRNAIDASSDESMKASIDSVKADLSPEDKEKFEESVMLLAFEGENLFQMAADSEGATRRMKDRLDGKTAAEVIAEADKIRLEREIKEQQQIANEIAELESKKKAAEAALEKLKAFEVKRSRFYFSDNGFSRDPIIELTVSNGLETAVSRAYFHGILATPGRSVPWVKDDFNYSIRGGLEPGEEATWKLSPNMFGEWGQAPKERTDMVLTVTVTKLDGPDEEPILDGEFSEYDQERLDELKAKLK